jgi:hypothetical protein
MAEPEPTKVRAIVARMYFEWRDGEWGLPRLAESHRTRPRYESPAEGLAGEPCPDGLSWPEHRFDGLLVSRVRRFPLPVSESGLVVGRTVRVEGTYQGARQTSVDGDYDPPYLSDERRIGLVEVLLDERSPSGLARLVLVHPIDLGVDDG